MRRASVAFFLGDPAFLSDSKFRALARRLPDPDDFNAAVGAFWIIVAACRRNGSPVIDAEAETGSAHVATLREVGLLTDEGLPRSSFEAWAPMSPQQAAAGKARADGAVRGERGQFLPNPARSSGTSALDTLTSAVQPSPPLPSSHVQENDVGSLDGGDSSEPEGPAITWLAQRACLIRPGDGYHRTLVTGVERHGVIAIIRQLERLEAAGMPRGDLKGYLFGAIDELDKAKRPSPGALAAAEASDRTRRGVEATRRERSELESIGKVVGSLADLGVLDPRSSP
jgi:hypothetical protein